MAGRACTQRSGKSLPTSNTARAFLRGSGLYTAAELAHRRLNSHHCERTNATSTAERRISDTVPVPGAPRPQTKTLVPEQRWQLIRPPAPPFPPSGEGKGKRPPCPQFPSHMDTLCPRPSGAHSAAFARCGGATRRPSSRRSRASRAAASKQKPKGERRESAPLLARKTEAERRGRPARRRRGSGPEFNRVPRRPPIDR